MGKNENIIKFSPQLMEERQPGYGPSLGLWRALPLTAGPGIVVAAILLAHGYNLYVNWQNYLEAPPTISRALLDPAIAGPFAFAMIVSAIFLAWGVLQVAKALWQLITRTRQSFALSLALLIAGIFCEFIAIAGMVVLSQFTGNVSQPLHDLGSYMLFFGHSIGISMLGVMIRLQLSVFGGQNVRYIASSNVFLTLRKQPRRAAGIAVLGALFGVTYFGGKFLPDIYFFWQRTIMSVLEVLVIFSFLGFLVAFGPFMGFWSHGRRVPAREVASGKS
jgi:hypothetical protein